jgi:hypothetical protein
MASRSRRAGGALLSILVLGFGSLILVTAAVGWLYWLREFVADWPGPRLANALPLDALSLRDSVPTVVFIVVFAGVGALAGSGRRRLQIRRAWASLGLGLWVWVLLYCFDTISLFTVRQIPFVQALRQALPLLPIYLGALVATLGEALPNRRAWRGVSSRATRPSSAPLASDKPRHALEHSDR